MATNFIQPGDVVTVPAPSGGTVSGAGYVIGSLFGVATTTTAQTEPVALALTGVFDLPKAPSQAWTVGALIYWDAAEARCTTTASTNKIIGVAVAAVGAGAGETVGRVRLNGGAVN